MTTILAGMVHCIVPLTEQKLELKIYQKLYGCLAAEADIRGVTPIELAWQLITAHLGGGDVIAKLQERVRDDSPFVNSKESVAVGVLANAMMIINLRGRRYEK